MRAPTHARTVHYTFYLFGGQFSTSVRRVSPHEVLHQTDSLDVGSCQEMVRERALLFCDSTVNRPQHTKRLRKLFNSTSLVLPHTACCEALNPPVSREFPLR